MDMLSERVQGQENVSELNDLLWEVSSLQAVVTLMELLRKRPNDAALSGELQQTLAARGESGAGIGEADLRSRREALATAREKFFRHLRTMPL
jgi:hypothetical protein